MALPQIIQEGLRSSLGNALPIKVLPVDLIMANSEAANYLGFSERTLNRRSFPSCLNGPKPIRYGLKSNLRWSKLELDAYVARTRLRADESFANSTSEVNPFADLLED